MNTKMIQQQVDDIFANFNQPGSPGAAVAVAQDGKILFQQGYGLSNIELDVPVTPKSVFNIGSMAKQFTAFAIALLADEAKLSLDDDIRQYLPEMPEYEDVITIRHLVHHTSGIRNSFPALLSLAEWRDTDATSTDDVFKLLQLQRGLNFKPGDQHEYSNSNYILLALIVAQVSGKSFGKFLQETIFTPLEMNDSAVKDSFVKLIPNRTVGYHTDEGKSFLAPLTDSVIGSTNIYTNVLDLAKWEHNFSTRQIGSDRIFDQMLQCGVLNDGRILDYAFGLTTGPAHQHRGWQIVEHGGSHGGYSSHMMRFSETNLSVIVLFNSFLWEAREFALKVADLFLEDYPDDQPVQEESSSQPLPAMQLTDEQQKEKVGVYFSESQSAIREISIKDGKLFFNQYVILPIDENLFYFEVAPDTKIQFEPAERKRTPSMTTITPSGDYRYERIEEDSTKDIDPNNYTGKYYSPDLDVYWKIDNVDAVLTVTRRKYPQSPLTHLFADTFTDDWGPLLGYPTTYTLQFSHDEQGWIIGLAVSGSGVRGLQFMKCAS